MLTDDVCLKLTGLCLDISKNENKARNMVRGLSEGHPLREGLWNLAADYSVLMAAANEIQGLIAALRMTHQVPPKHEHAHQFTDGKRAAANDHDDA